MEENIEEVEEELSDIQANKIYWKEFYKDCIKCINECKQSSKITTLNCPNFIKKN